MPYYPWKMPFYHTGVYRVLQFSYNLANCPKNYKRIKSVDSGLGQLPFLHTLSKVSLKAPSTMIILVEQFIHSNLSFKNLHFRRRNDLVSQKLPKIDSKCSLNCLASQIIKSLKFLGYLRIGRIYDMVIYLLDSSIES